ncbi:hypothetical protein QCD79_22720, partial [Pseudomonas quasicaspiana]|nr:hypothetical protein [Pseudomonas quasicaspiana]
MLLLCILLKQSKVGVKTVRGKRKKAPAHRDEPGLHSITSDRGLSLSQEEPGFQHGIRVQR